MSLRKALFLGVIVTMGLAAWAQDVPKVEVYGDYSFVHFNPSKRFTTSHDLNGGGGGIVFNFGKYFGFRGDLQGYESETNAFIIPTGGIAPGVPTRPVSVSVNGNLFTYLFGPQIKRHGRFAPFGTVLVGGAHSNVYANAYKDVAGVGVVGVGSAPSNNAFALFAGGGVDIGISRHFALRPVEFGYLLTRFGNNFTGAGGSNQNSYRYDGGVVLSFGGGAKPEKPVSAACAASPTSVMAGEPVSVTLTPTDFNPKRTLTYAWTSTGGKSTGTGATASIDTAGLAPGDYTAKGTVTDNGKGKHQMTANCSATFTIQEPPKHPPTLSCSATPTTVKPGEPATITCEGASPDNSPLTYACQSSAGRISGKGATETLDTTGAPGGSITVNCTVSDARNLTATSSATVNVEVPPPPPQASKVNECDFTNMKKPWRVDNACKAKLDDVALALRNDPNVKSVIVGYATAEETSKKANAKLAAQRAYNSKVYLTTGEAHHDIDAGRIEVRTGSGDFQKTENWIVPAGATFSQADTTVVDESTMKK